MVIDRFFKSGGVPPPMEARKILIPRNLNVMISRYEWFLTYFCQQAKKVEQVIFCPMNVPQPPFLSRWFKQVMYRSLKTGHIQVIFSFGSVGTWWSSWPYPIVSQNGEPFPPLLRSPHNPVEFSSVALLQPALWPWCTALTRSFSVTATLVQRRQLMAEEMSLYSQSQIVIKCWCPWSLCLGIKE